MNHAKLKDYAPKARLDFLEAVTDRAAFYGVTAQEIAPVTVKGDVAIIAGRAVPASLVPKRKKLVERIERYGFNQTMEALAYTWFNRFVAIRYMELHGYLEHGYRVLSHADPAKTIPEILELAEHVDLPGLSKEHVIDLKLDANKEPELYRLLLLAQCHALHSAMPFLFEGIDDETELVLPENLLHSDSIVRKLVAASDPPDWQEVEVIGWLYQYYISERKDQVMAQESAVRTEDIPARTQMFTPHWIVRYLVENSLGRLWLLNRPSSRLREHMPYYIEGEPGADFLKITKPEDIRLLDPACGSGHMLTYAFDLLFLIYQEEGHVPDKIPALILRHNLYGLEICPRAAQLANLAVVFKAREESTRFLQPGHLVQPNVFALQNLHFSAGELRDYISALDLGDLFTEQVTQLMHQFEEATNFGSLIQPGLDEAVIADIRHAIEAKDLGGQLFLQETHAKVLRVLEQAEMLGQRYHVVVANPPYMGRDVFNTSLKAFVKMNVAEGAIDLYGCFIVRNLRFLVKLGYCGMITIPNWMFLPSSDELREALYQTASIKSLLHNGRGVWGSDFGSCSFVIQKGIVAGVGRYKRLFVLQGEVNPNEVLIERFHDNNAFPYHLASSAEFEHIPNKPIAYWISPKFRSAFANSKLSRHAESGGRCKTSKDQAYLRFIWEVDAMKVGVTGSWCPMFKGGEYRKYFGNLYHVMKWTPDAKEYYRTVGGLTQERFWNRTGITWTIVSANAHASFRHKVSGAQYNSVSPTLFFHDANEEIFFLGLLNSKPVNALLQIMNPTLALNVGDLLNLPVPPVDFRDKGLQERIQALFSLSQSNWNNSETSWSFRDQPLLRPTVKGATLAASWRHWEAEGTTAIQHSQELEKENNQFFISAYGLADELTPEVPEGQVTLARPDARGGMAAFLSYAVGCMMGRYSLDNSGLILANLGDSLPAYLEKVGKSLGDLTFRPSDDGVLPVLDGEWFAEDVAARCREFLRATFGEATLEANVRFIEESLGKDLRKYFLADFYKDHLQTYKKRPIYWLFSSGKERAFQALVYLHRYHEGTLSRMRTEYVIPLQGKIASRIDGLADDIQKAASTSHRKKMEKERDKLLKQQAELRAFDERLRHFADRRIQLDLDDGVKVNYGKFGDLLAEVKAVTGGSDE